MKKLRTLFAAMAFIGIALSVTSCSKEKPAEPKGTTAVEQLNSQANYTVKSLAINEYSMLPIVSGQLHMSEPAPVLIEISVNKLDTDVKNQRSSTMKPEKFGQSQTIKFVEVADNKVAISFIGNHSLDAGEAQNNPIPQSLMQMQLFNWNYADNGNYTWLTFDPSKHLNGIYSIETVKTGDEVTGFVLTYEEGLKKVKMELSKELQ